MEGRTQVDPASHRRLLDRSLKIVQIGDGPQRLTPRGEPMATAGALACPAGDVYFLSLGVPCTSFICSPQQISECGIPSGQGQGFS